MMCQGSLRINTKSLSRNLFRKLINSFRLIFCFIPQRRVKVLSIEYFDVGISETCKWVGIPAADSPIGRIVRKGSRKWD